MIPLDGRNSPPLALPVEEDVEELRHQSMTLWEILDHLQETNIADLDRILRESREYMAQNEAKWAEEHRQWEERFRLSEERARELEEGNRLAEAEANEEIARSRRILEEARQRDIEEEQRQQERDIEIRRWLDNDNHDQEP